MLQRGRGRFFTCPMRKDEVVFHPSVLSLDDALLREDHDSASERTSPYWPLRFDIVEPLQSLSNYVTEILQLYPVVNGASTNAEREPRVPGI